MRNWPTASRGKGEERRMAVDRTGDRRDVSGAIGLATRNGARGKSCAPRIRIACLVGAFAVAAALLTAVGIFGVIGRAVTQRRREIAVRLALGAPGSAIARAVASRQGRSIAIGLAGGVLGAWLVAPVLGRFVYGVSPTDPTALAGAVVALAIVAVAAACAPLRSAMRTDPGLVLRDTR